MVAYGYERMSSTLSLLAKWLSYEIYIFHMKYFKVLSKAILKTAISSIHRTFVSKMFSLAPTKVGPILDSANST